MSRKISLHFQPVLHKNSGIETMAIEKNIDGKRKRYLEGVSSGLSEDAHGEKMSKSCIKGFMEQANSGDILLYPDIHGIKAFTGDIGILEKSEILDNGDWFTSYRLFDVDDNPGQVKLEAIEDIWKKCNGFPPYKKPMRKGFSIEGIIPESGIVQNSRGETILDNIELDGVVLVPRPAYMDSIANAVYKALEELPPWRVTKTQKSIQGKLNEIMQEKEIENQYWNKKYDIEYALTSSIEDIMQDPQDMKQERLNIIFDEYKNTMIGLLMSSQAMFKQDTLKEEVRRSINSKKNKEQVMKAINSEFAKLLTVIQRSVQNGKQSN